VKKLPMKKKKARRKRRMGKWEARWGSHLFLIKSKIIFQKIIVTTIKRNGAHYAQTSAGVSELAGWANAKATAALGTAETESAVGTGPSRIARRRKRRGWCWHWYGNWNRRWNWWNLNEFVSKKLFIRKWPKRFTKNSL
jgi:hypothetical protein